MWIDLFASLSFYVIPWWIGRLFSRSVLYAWASGALVLFLLFFADSGMIRMFPSLSFAGVMQGSVLFLSVASLILTLFAFPKIAFSKKTCLYGLLVFLASLFYFFLMWKQDTPYPFQLNWDMYEHITLAHLIAGGNLSFLPSRISDTFTFDGYSPLFHILLSIPEVLFKRNLVGIYWWLEYWHYALTIFATGLLTWEVFKNKWLVASGLIINLFVFESTVVYSSLFLIPQTLVALIVALAVAKTLTEKKTQYANVIIMLFVLFLLHYAIGLIACVIYIAFIIKQQKHLPASFLRRAMILSCILFAAALLLHLFGSWFLTGREEAVHFTFSLQQTLSYFLDWYGVLPLLFFPVGIGIAFYKKSETLQFICIISMIILSISIAPFSYVLKYDVLNHYFLPVIMVAGIGSIVFSFGKIGKVLLLGGFATLMFVVFYLNQATYKAPLYLENTASHFSQEEWDAGMWLETRTNNAFLVSDPSTQYILEGISGMNTQGGAYMNEVTRQKLMSIAYVTDTKKIAQTVVSIKDEVTKKQSQQKTYLVLSGRYFAWQQLPKEQKMSFYNNIWSPQLLSQNDLAYIAYLKSQKLHIVFQNDALVIISL